MKRLAVLLVTLFAASFVQANTWGLFRPIIETPEVPFAVDNLLDRRPIRYAVEAEMPAELQSVFQTNLQRWPKETLAYIRKYHRAKDLADIVAILARPLEVQEVNYFDNPDVYLLYIEEENNGAGQFEAATRHRPARVGVLGERDFFNRISLHEIGHYYGLGDQYAEGIANVYPTYSSDVDTIHGSIMQGSLSTDGKLTCDDFDGLINLIDVRLSQRNGGRFSPRAERGWKSLCPDSERLYKEGEPDELDVATNHAQTPL